MFNLLKHELFSRRGAMVGWGIALGLFSSLYIVIYPEMQDMMADLASFSIYQAMGLDVGTFKGFIASVSVQIIPIVLGVYMIMASTNTLAGEEDNGTLELVVAMPLERWQIVAMKALALVIVSFFALVLIAGISAVSLAAILSMVETDATPMQLFVAFMGAWPLMIATIALGMFFGSIMPSRGVALAIMAVIYLVSYLMNSVAGLVDSLEGVKNLSIFHYVDSTAGVFENGLAANNIAILLGIAAIFFGLTMVAFKRRSITVGLWPWQTSQAPA